MNAIETHALTRRFGPRTAVDGLDLTVRQGELFALLGVNGAGKTTTLRMLSGLLQPTGGEADILGFRLTQQPQEGRVFHAGKAVCREDRRVDKLPQRVLVVFSLNDDGLPEFQLIHAAPPAQAGRAAGPYPEHAGWRSGRSGRSHGGPPSWSDPRDSS